MRYLLTSTSCLATPGGLEPPTLDLEGPGACSTSRELSQMTKDRRAGVPHPSTRFTTLQVQRTNEQRPALTSSQIDLLASLDAQREHDARRGRA